MRAFLMVYKRKVEQTVRYDLLVDDVLVLNEVPHIQAYEYCLKNMSDEDTYREPHMHVPFTGKKLRARYNFMERSYGEDGSYKPQYYPSPITGEVEFQSVYNTSPH